MFFGAAIACTEPDEEASTLRSVTGGGDSADRTPTATGAGDASISTADGAVSTASDAGTSSSDASTSASKDKTDAGAAGADAGAKTDASTDAGAGTGATYSTPFATAEEPLSEGGEWHHLDATLTPCKTVGGVAFGTQSGSGTYDDSNVYLTGFGNDYEVEGTVWVNPSLSGGANREVEILLRWSDNGPLRSTPYGSTHANGYEINWSHLGAYLILGRFKGDEVTRAPSPAAPHSGDKLRARIEGQRIRVWINDVIQIDHTDNDAALGITTGNPGIGFYVDANTPNSDFGFDAVTVRAL